MPWWLRLLQTSRRRRRTCTVLFPFNFSGEPEQGSAAPGAGAPHRRGVCPVRPLIPRRSGAQCRREQAASRCGPVRPAPAGPVPAAARPRPPVPPRRRSALCRRRGVTAAAAGRGSRASGEPAARPVTRPPARHLNHEGSGGRASSSPPPRRPPSRSRRPLPHLRPSIAAAPRPPALRRGRGLLLARRNFAPLPGSWRGPWGKSLHPESSRWAGEASARVLQGGRGIPGCGHLAPKPPPLREVGAPPGRFGGAGTAAEQDAPRFFHPGAGDGPQLPRESPGRWRVPSGPRAGVARGVGPLSPGMKPGGAKGSAAAPWLHLASPILSTDDSRDLFGGKASEIKVSRLPFPARSALAWHRRGWVCFGVSRYFP